MPGSSAAPAARIRPARRRWSAAAARSGADLPGAPARTGGSSLGALRCKTTGDVLKDLEKMGKSIETPWKNQMSWLWWLWSWFHSGKKRYFLMEKKIDGCFWKNSTCGLHSQRQQPQHMMRCLRATGNQAIGCCTAGGFWALQQGTSQGLTCTDFGVELMG